MVATVALGALMFVGNTWGEDDHFPFGPFRMYSISNDMDGRITSLLFKGRLEGKTPGTIPFMEMGLRRAEAQGQLRRYQSDDRTRLLRRLVSAYDRFNPEGPRLLELSLVYEVDTLSGGRPVAHDEKVLASWSRP